MRQAGLAGLLVVGLAAGAAGAEEWTRQYTVSGRPQVRVTADDASVSIASSDGRQVDVRVTATGWSIGPDGVRISDTQTGDRLELEVRLPHEQWGWMPRHRSVKVEMRVPRESDIDVRTGDGSVSVQPVSGHVRIETGDGSISVEGLRGDVQLRTGDGGIDAAGIEASLRAHTGDGHLRVRGRFDVLDLSTGDGSIDAQVEAGSKPSAGWALRSGDGSITLGLPSDFAADLDAHTGDGHITLDLPVSVEGRISSSTVRGKLNGGGPVVTLRSGDGSIRLQGR
jgi:DUF4097 and DUF4098 domain-containing protein YvlB